MIASTPNRREQPQQKDDAGRHMAIWKDLVLPVSSVTSNERMSNRSCNRYPKVFS
eukprot:CAMPEP_0172744036 /NCGR_PEP_ID=MMETSP1074-20121228/134073_1 /TAXON_ID=2916 /ORGANISM="Ceratium fusus, Strain PA161109" /LENGTH=54 /DNA_ID=CAMNT_0013574893 /DNA_START=121 /DNA_END=281 /DNA_ORIENTATION=+